MPVAARRPAEAAHGFQVTKSGCGAAGFFIGRQASNPLHFARSAFISRSENKVGGTPRNSEHRAIPFVVGAGNADT
jgi:hypothetical protein